MVDIVVLIGFVAVNGATGNGFGGDNGSTFVDDDDAGGGTTSVGDDTCFEIVFGGCNFHLSIHFFMVIFQFQIFIYFGMPNPFEMMD